MVDLSTVSRDALRKDTMLQHPIFLYQLRMGIDDCDGEEVSYYWDTDRVFATADEARAYGKSNEHNDGKEGEGWRVYSVPAAGALRAALEKAMAP